MRVHKIYRIILINQINFYLFCTMNAPVNTIIVRIAKKFYDSVTFDSGQTIFFDPSWHPEEYAMIRATVVSVPRGIIHRHDYAGVKIEMQPGDEILMRYDVIFAYKDQPDRDTPTYKNLLFQFNEETGQHEEYWLCDILQVFAIIREQPIMVNDYVMLEPIFETRSGSEIIITPDSYRTLQLKDRAVVRHIGFNPVGLSVGDTVIINPQTVMNYSYDTNSFLLIKQRNILAKVN